MLVDELTCSIELLRVELICCLKKDALRFSVGLLPIFFDSVIQHFTLSVLVMAWELECDFLDVVGHRVVGQMLFGFVETALVNRLQLI